MSPRPELGAKALCLRGKRSRVRGLLLLSVVGLLWVLAPQPNDTAALRDFQQVVRWAPTPATAFDLDQPGLTAGVPVLLNHQATLQRVIARRPFDPQPWRELGHLYAYAGQEDAALHAYGQALRHNDHTLALQAGLARVYAQLDNPRQSAQLLADYLTRRPTDCAARSTYALLQIWLREWEQAQAELEQCLAAEPANQAIHTWLGLLLIGPAPETGLAHLQHASVDPIVARFVESQALAGSNPAYRWALLGVAFLDLDVSILAQSHQPGFFPPDKLDRVTSMLAVQALLTAVRYNPIYADAYAYLGQALDQAASADGQVAWSRWALASLQYALKLAPQSSVVQALAGLYWDRRGAPAVARGYYEAAYHQNEDNQALCLEIAASYAAEREYTAAESWLLAALSIAPEDPRTWAMLAHFYLDSGIGVQESGLPAAARLVQLVPEDAQAHDLIGWAYFLTGDITNAQASLERAVALDPTLASAHYHLGRLHAQQGLFTSAAGEYRRALELDRAGQLAQDLDRAWQELPPAFRQEP